MSDPSLVRNLAGVHFTLADTQRHERGEELNKGLERMLRNLSGWLPPKRLRRTSINSFASKINHYASGLKTLNQEEIQQRFLDGLKTLKLSNSDQQALTVVFACVGEGSRRALGMWPHPVQFSGAHVLLTGRLAEMQTGEGKTLVAGLAATVMAGSGAHVHVVSTNDYLAERDCHEMLALFQFFGLEGGFVKEGMEVPDRQKAYRLPICYASGKEIVFDYLKDRLSGHGILPARISHLRQMTASGHQDSEPIIPALHFSIVDEADSVLIDEARTPMILSREAPAMIEPELLVWALAQAKTLQPDVDFKLDQAQHDIEIRTLDLTKLELLPNGIRAVWRAPDWQRMILRQALMALHFYHLDQQYILVEGKVQIVDESSGRVMADRSWEQGLHQLIETKEGVELTSGRETLARMTFQRFFRRYFLLAGLTGTGTEVSRELWSVYRLKTCCIPTNKPNRRVRLHDQCYSNDTEKWVAVAADAIRASKAGQPVLIGTRSVEASEAVSQALMDVGVEHVVLNARQDEDEAKIVADAGQIGQITVATNMAGRGTDIKLTEAARQAGGLHVILTEFHESTRIDRQLFGRSGRQGDKGTSRAIVSTEDTLIVENGGLLGSILQYFNSNYIQRIFLKLCILQAQRIAQRRSYRVRMQTLDQDRRLSRQIGFAGKTL